MDRIPSSTAQRLQQLILSGAYPCGSFLPSQRLLAQELGISRASLREALSVLEALGLVEMAPGKGCKVCGPDMRPAQAIRSFATPDWGSLTPRQLFELRYVLEPGWTALAANHLQAHDLRQLQWLQQAMEAALHRHDFRRAVQADVDFHLLLAQLCGNPGLQAMAQQMQHAIGHSLSMPFVWTGADTAPAQEHLTIVQALMQHDAPAAAQAMRQHLIHAAQRCGVELFPPPQAAAADSASVFL